MTFESLALLRAELRADKTTDDKRAMIDMTTSNSMRVKPLLEFVNMFPLYQKRAKQKPPKGGFCFQLT
jgi:hypothetical protein